MRIRRRRGVYGGGGRLGWRGSERGSEEVALCITFFGFLKLSESRTEQRFYLAFIDRFRGFKIIAKYVLEFCLNYKIVSLVSETNKFFIQVKIPFTKLSWMLATWIKKKKTDLTTN